MIKAKIIGADKFIKYVEGKGYMSRGLVKMYTDYGKEVRMKARENAPFFGGELRRNIFERVDKNRPLPMWVKIGVFKTHLIPKAAAMEKGTRRGHFPPLIVLKGWALAKGLNAFLVARSIARRGLRPRRYLQRAQESTKLPIRTAEVIIEQDFVWP